MDIEQELLNAVRDGIRKGVEGKLVQGYNSPLDALLKEVLSAADSGFRSVLTDAVQSAVGDPAFREEIRSSVRHKLAQVLVARFGGELERQVNQLKSDPATRARITIAIEEIVKERATV